MLRSREEPSLYPVIAQPDGHIFMSFATWDQCLSGMTKGFCVWIEGEVAVGSGGSGGWVMKQLWRDHICAEAVGGSPGEAGAAPRPSLSLPVSCGDC